MANDGALAPVQAEPAQVQDAAEYTIRIPVFEGPLDLLLHLIKVNELDITDIPIEQITRQYLAFLEFMKELNLEIAGEFLVMAATLMVIKSQVLLPRSPFDEEEAGEDPRQKLMQQLLTYEQFRLASDSLNHLWSLSHTMWHKGEAYRDEEQPEMFEFKVSLFELIAAFKELMSGAKAEELREITPQAYSIKEKIMEIMTHVTARKRMKFDELFASCGSKLELIMTFLALLEVVRLKMVYAAQVEPGGVIWIRKVSGHGRE